jgi:hypothetical protein
VKPWIIASVFALGVVAGCMAAGPPAPAQQPSEPRSPLGTPFSQRNDLASTISTPLIVDRLDLRLGTTVQYQRIPTVSELHDLTQLPGLAHIVLSLPEWPGEYAPLQPLNQIPQGSDLIVILPGYPPAREAADAWSYVNAPIRIVVVVAGPPPSNGLVLELNSMARLERVIAQMDEPTRSGFEQLQRPLQFRRLIE